MRPDGGMIWRCLGAWLCWAAVAVAAEVPQELGARGMPGAVPSDTLRLKAPDAVSVELRSSADGWAEFHALRREDGLWSTTVGESGLAYGVHEFKFVVDGEWEDGENRTLYVNRDGQIVRPPAFFLTWQGDPTTTMTAVWLTDEAGAKPEVSWRREGDEEWRGAEGDSQPFPFSTRMVQTVEMTGLAPGTTYDYRMGDDPTVRTFATLPATLERPVKFVQGGDVYHEGEWMDRMNSLAAEREPDFAVIGGDLAYADGEPGNVSRWHRYLQSFSDHFITAGGRVIPVIVTIGNHEVRRTNQHIIDDASLPRDEAERRDLAPYFYALFPWPGDPGYASLDAGDYLSFLLLDTNHLNPVEGAQTEWLQGELEARAGRPHVLPVYHVPAYPSVRAFNDPVSAAVRRAWLPLFEKAGVKLAFEHHDHAFKVTPPIKAGEVDEDGIVFLGDGAWAVNVRETHDPDTTWYLDKADDVLHLHEVVLEKDRRTVVTLGIDGQELHRLEQAVGTGGDRRESPAAKP